MKAIIFAGGVGTRLWPLSRKKSPKQFEKIVSDKSTLQLAAERLLPDFSWSDIYIATGKAYTHTVTEQLPEIPAEHIIGEPAMRDNGPAVGLATALLVRESPHEPMVILWSDHLVHKAQHFRKILMAAGEVVSKQKDKIVFVSQKPRFASENLGWIQFGEEVMEKDEISFRRFVDFRYRPDAETAQRYFHSGHHAWNLGYFVTTPAFLWEQYEAHAPELAAGLLKIADSFGTAHYAEKLEEIYPTLEKISFDNIVLEKLLADHAYVVSDNIGWSDIGAWEALKEALEDAEHKNVTQGKVLLTDTLDSLVYNYTEQLVVTIDMQEMLVVNTPDVLMICHKKSVPKIKKLVEKLSNTEHEHLT